MNFITSEKSELNSVKYFIPPPAQFFPLRQLLHENEFCTKHTLSELFIEGEDVGLSFRGINQRIN